MLWSKLFIPTLRENPAEAEVVSHQLLLRAGYIRQLAAGIYSYLFLAQRSILKITRIVREEMDAIGAQEMLLPALNPAEVWQESGRWDIMGDNLFRLKDRFGRDLCLGMTHEEVMTSIARGELRSYKQLPQIWYQIQTKFRDEPRPKSGFAACAAVHYEGFLFLRYRRCGTGRILRQALRGVSQDFRSLRAKVHGGGGAFGRHGRFAIARIHGGFRRRRGLCGELPRMRLRGQSGKSRVACYALSRLRIPKATFLPRNFILRARKQSRRLSAFTKLPESSQMKSLVLVADGKPVLAMVRGDHSLSETKFTSAVKATEFRPAHPEEIRQLFGADAGSLGPVGVKNMRVIADDALKGRRNMIAGSNKDDYHLRHVTPGEDFQPEYFDLRQVAAGDGCSACDGTLELIKSVEIGHIFKLGYRYSDSMGLRVLNEAGEEIKVIMGSYGIGVERILAAAIELYHDKDGMALPAAIAPFDVVVTPVNNADATLRAAAQEIYESCRKMDLDVLLDDRDERPGVKFKDADLIGIPYRITVGKKLAQGQVEITDRGTKKSEDVDKDYAAAFVASKIRE